MHFRKDDCEYIVTYMNIYRFIMFLSPGELSGFKDFIPPFAGASLEQAHTGMNYASGGSGLREETSEHLVRSKNYIEKLIDFVWCNK